MAHSASAKKRIRQNEKRRLHNRYYRVMARRAIKAVLQSDNYEDAFEKFRFATKILDRIADRGIVHKNYAANKKSKLAKYLNKLKAQVS